MPPELLSTKAKVGDVLRVEVEMSIEGISILEVLPPKERRQDSGARLIEHRGSEKFTEGVVVPPGLEDGERGDASGDKRRRASGGRGGFGRSAGGGRRRDDAGRENRGGRGENLGQRHRPQQRLRVEREHINAWLLGLPDAQRKLGKLIAARGVWGLRKAVAAELNAVSAGEEDEKAAPASQFPSIAEAAGALGLDAAILEGAQSQEERRKVLSKHMSDLDRLADSFLAAEWKDRADAAGRAGDKLDLRDLRSVVAADHRARGEEAAEETAAKLRKRLADRLEREQAAWLSSLGSAVSARRVTAALRMSCRPPRVGVPLPNSLLERLRDLINESLNAEESEEAWLSMLQAASTSPVRMAVRPRSLPAKCSEKLRAEVARLADRLPGVAAAFEALEPQATA